MKYVALLRGINVGGNRRVEMKRLKVAFERVGMENVTTYINSGNVVFDNSVQSVAGTTKILETAIEEEFGFFVKVLVRDKSNIDTIAKALPSSWVNDDTMKCDAMFLWEKIATREVMNQLTIKPEIDDVKYVESTILWRVDRQDVTRSGMMKLVGTDLYAHMTIRNCNTLRKLAALMNVG